MSLGKNSGSSSSGTPSSGGNTSTVIQQSQPPQAFLDAYTNLNAQAQALAAKPFPGNYPGNLVAGFTPQQTQAFQTVGNIQGQFAPYLNTAGQAFAQATQPLWPSLPQYDTSGLPAAGIGAIGNATQYAAGAAQPIAQTVSPYAGLASSAAQNIPGAVSPLTSMAASAAQNAPGSISPYTGFAGSTAAGLGSQVAPYTGFAGNTAAGLQGNVAPYTGFAGSTAAGLQGNVAPYTGFAGSTAAGLPGQISPYTGMATGAGSSIPGALAPSTGFAQNTAAGLGSQVSPFTSGAQQSAASTLSSTPSFFNPYTQNVTDALTALYGQQNAEQLAQVRGSSVGQGAYGGDREKVAEALTARQQQLAQAPVLAQVQQQGYQSSLQAAQQQAALEAQTGLSAGQLTTQAGLGAGQLGLGAGQLTLGGLGTQGQLGLGAGQLTTQAGLGAGQLGLGAGQLTTQAGTAAGQLGLGAGQLTTQAGTAAGQLGLGAGQLTSQTGLGAGQLGLGAGQLTGQIGLGAGQLAGTTAGQVNQALTSAGQLGLGAGQLMSGAMGTQGQLGLGAGQLNLAAGQGLMQDFSQQQQAQLAAEQANAWLASQAGVGIAGLGAQQQQLGLSGASALEQTGGLQQQLAQEQLNIPYEQWQAQQAYPYQQLNFLAPIAEGTGSLAGGSSSTSYPGPSLVSQLGGLGVAGLGLAGVTGGFGPSGYLTNLFSPSGVASDFTGGAELAGLGAGAVSAIPPAADAFSSALLAAPLVKRGGRVGFATGGDVGLGTPLGPDTIPQVPVLSLDYIQAPGPAIKGQGPPRAPSPGGMPQGQSDSQSIMQDVQAIKGLKDLGVFKGFGGDGAHDGGSYQRGGGLGSTALDEMRGGLHARGMSGIGQMGVPHASLAHLGVSPHMRLQMGGMGEEPLAAADPYVGNQNPLVQGQYQRFQQMPLEQLEELSLRVGQSTPQGQMIQRAVMAKKMTPSAGLGTAATPPGSTPTDFLPMQPGTAGGTAQPMAAGGEADRNYVTEDELDPHPVVDHSGDTIKIHYPSEGTTLDLGLPTSFRRRALAAGGSSGPGLGAGVLASDAQINPNMAAGMIGSIGPSGLGGDPGAMAAHPGAIPALSTQPLTPVGNPFAGITPPTMPNVGSATAPQPMTYRDLTPPMLNQSLYQGAGSPSGTSAPVVNPGPVTPPSGVSFAAPPSAAPDAAPAPAAAPTTPSLDVPIQIPSLDQQPYQPSPIPSTVGQQFTIPQSKDTFVATGGGGYVDLSQPLGANDGGGGGGGDGKRGGAMRPRLQEGGDSDDGLGSTDLDRLRDAGISEGTLDTLRAHAGLGRETPPLNLPSMGSSLERTTSFPYQEQQLSPSPIERGISAISTAGRHSDYAPGSEQDPDRAFRQIMALRGEPLATPTQPQSEPPAAAPGDARATQDPVARSGLGINQAQLGRETASLTGAGFGATTPPRATELSPFDQPEAPSWQMGSGLGSSSLATPSAAPALSSGPDSLMRPTPPTPGAREIPSGTGSTAPASGAPGTWGPKLAGAADRYGIPQSLMFKTAQLESGLHPNPQAGWPNNNVLNLNERNWKDMGGGDINDPDTQADRGAKWLSQMHQQTKQLLGHEPEDWQTYILFQQGPGGGPALLNAPQGMNVVDALTPAYKGDRATAMKAVTGNAGNLSMTAQDFVNLQRQRFEGYGGRFNPQAPLPASQPGGGAQAGAPGLGAGALAGTGEPSTRTGMGVSGLGAASPSASTNRDWTQSPWLPVMAAGFGMMASRSPYPLQALGEGGLQGVKSAEVIGGLGVRQQEADYRGQLAQIRGEGAATLADVRLKAQAEKAASDAGKLQYQYNALEEKIRSGTATLAQQKEIADTKSALDSSKLELKKFTDLAKVTMPKSQYDPQSGELAALQLQPDGSWGLKPGWVPGAPKTMSGQQAIIHDMINSGEATGTSDAIAKIATMKNQWRSDPNNFRNSMSYANLLQRNYASIANTIPGMTMPEADRQALAKKTTEEFLQQGVAHTPQAGGASAPTQAAPQQTAPPQVAPPAGAIAQLKQSPSASNKAWFDRTFGVGSAERALGTQ